jgi:hypothetical protein
VPIGLEPPRDARAFVSANFTWKFIDGANADVRVWSRKGLATDAAIATIIRDEMDAFIWPELVPFMGQAPLPDDKQHPPNDRLKRPDNGGSSSLDIVVAPLLETKGTDGTLSTLGEAFAYDFPKQHSPAQCFIVMNPDQFLLPTGALDTELIKATTAHEFMHAILFAFPLNGGFLSDSKHNWLSEATAQWAVGFVYPNNRYRHNYAQYFLKVPDIPIDEEVPALMRTTPRTPRDAETPALHSYGAYLFPFFLEHEYGYREKLIPDIWRASNHNPSSLDAIDSVLKDVENGLRGVWRVFVRRNWNQPPLDSYRIWGGLTEGARTVNTTPDGKNVVMKPSLGRGEREKTISLGLILKHLTALYYHFAFTDSKVKSITFHPPEFEPPTDAVTVGAVIKLKGETSGPYADWTKETKQTFRRDVGRGEQLEELVIMFSNSELTNDVRATREARIVLTTSSATVENVTLKPGGIIGGESTKGIVTLSEPAPEGGVLILLKSDNPAVAAVDKQVIVRMGAKNASFEIRTTPVQDDTGVSLYASRSENSSIGDPRQKQIVVLQPHLKSIKVEPTAVRSGESFKVIVTLTGRAPREGYLIRLRGAPGDDLVTYPSLIKVGPGNTTGTTPKDTCRGGHATLYASLPGKRQIVADETAQNAGSVLPVWIRILP